jgi:tRNA-dependent cyclodipeptide synthase
MISDLAFIGVSFDSKSFSREWVRSAMAWILEHHGSLLIVMADDLFYYTRTASDKDGSLFTDFVGATARVDSRRSEVEAFFCSEVDHLSAGDAGRVRIAKWGNFSDHHYSRILRFLRIAFEVIPDFQALVCELASVHARKTPQAVDFSRMVRLCVDFLLDEAAMCLRITELAGFCFEYYPGNDIPLLSELCAGRWAQSGLSVEALLGVKSKRRFTNLHF